MRSFCFLIFALCFCNIVLSDVTTTSPTSMQPYPVYKAQESVEYVPHKTYKDAGVRSDAFGYPSFDPYPTFNPTATPIQGPVQTVLSAVYKVGYFLFSGVALFIIGGIFITAICSLTSLCTITFAPLADIDKDAMVRSFMTPEKLASAAALVQDAVGKYQRLQKMKN